MTDPSYNCRDHQTFYALGVVLDAESLDPSVAIPALELLLPTTRYNENGERERHLVRLMIHYQYTASFNKLQELGQRELTDVPADLANYVRRAIAISFIGLGKEAEALSTLDEYISSGQGGVTRTDFHLAILLSERLNDDEKLHYFRELSNDHYQDLRWPSRLAGMSSDQFEIVFERLTNGTYLPRETELPRVTYPVAAERRSLNGKCDVFFDTDIEGRPINIEADCTDHIFVRSAERALAAARFEPLDFDGKRYPWIGIEYPIVYQISK
ncbi:MAG: energy transducer TonB [Pseudomonadota bacterium]